MEMIKQETEVAQIHRSDPADNLAACHFVDLYVANDPAEIPVVRGLALEGGGKMPGVQDLPEVFRGCILDLMRKIEKHHLETGEAEFMIRSGDTHFRTALIGAPLMRERPRPEQRRDWCVRRIGGTIPELGMLGIPDPIKEALHEAGRDRGLVMVAGPFGAGKSTTASAALVNWVASNRESAVTFEDPPEYMIGGRYPSGGIIYQIPVTHSTLSSAIVHSYRWAPRYAFLGEIRTPESAAQLLHMAIAGPLALCTIHASDPIQAIASLIRYSGSHIGDTEARRMIAASLRLVVHQDLSWGHMIARKLSLPAKGAEPLRNKIETGKLNMLYEDMERQAKFTA